jgi:tetratricopeptide (TPR) repeat protein
VRLFADRAAAAAPGFAVDGATVGAVVEVCRRLDGLPLALELAAARLRSLPVEQLAARLGDRFRLLTGGSRTALPRHRTLRAVVDWSWDLLTEPERRLARRLAVFAAGATVDGAAAVAADPGASPDDVLDGLAALVDRSLLQVVPGADPPRFRMLETIREYGLERLAEAGELAAVRDAHARWCADLVATAEPRLRGPEQVRWFQRLEAEREDVLAALRHLADAGEARAALALAVRLLWYWMLTGSPDEAIAWLGRALAVPGDADPLDRTIAEGVRSLFELGRGNADSEEGRARLGALSEALAGADDRGRPLVAVAKVAMPFVAGDPEEAERRLTLARAHPDPWVRATLELFAGGQAENDGDLDGTRAHLEAAVAAYRELGDRWGLAMALTLETGWLIPVGQLDRAEAALVEARAALDELDSAAGAGLIDLRLAEVALRRGDPEAARERVRRALDLLGGRDDRALAEATLARASWHAGDLEGARAALAAAAQQVERLGRGDPDPHAAATAEAFAARVELAVGDPAVAERWLAEAHGLARRTADMPIVAAVGVVAAAAAAHRGRAGDAAELLGGAAALRGADDATNPDVAELAARLRAELGEDAFAAAHARGRALHREDALALLAAASRPAPVGP